MALSFRKAPAFLCSITAVGALLGSTTLASAQGLPCPDLTPAQFQRFINITMQDEDGLDQRDFVIRWETDVLIRVLGTPTEADLANLDTVIAELTELTGGLPIRRLAPDEKGGNFTVQYEPIERYSEVLVGWDVPITSLETACATIYYWRRGAALEEARVLMPTNPAAHDCGLESPTMEAYAMSLALEEVTQGFGFPNDVDGERQSIFDQVGSPSAYSPTDRLIISALYCADVRAGMTEPALWSVLVPGAAMYLDLLERANSGAAMSPDDAAALHALLTDMGYKVGLQDGTLNPDMILASAQLSDRLVAK